jgi:hypothetical protein
MILDFARHLQMLAHLNLKVYPAVQFLHVGTKGHLVGSLLLLIAAHSFHMAALSPAPLIHSLVNEVQILRAGSRHHLVIYATQLT